MFNFREWLRRIGERLIGLTRYAKPSPKPTGGGRKKPVYWKKAATTLSGVPIYWKKYPETTRMIVSLSRALYYRLTDLGVSEEKAVQEMAALISADSTGFRGS